MPRTASTRTGGGPLARRLARGAAVCLSGALLGAAGASAAWIPRSPLPAEQPVWVDFEVLPTDERRRLPEALRTIEGVKWSSSDSVVGERTFRKASATVTVAGGGRREVIALLQAETDGLRMLGFNRVEREGTASRHDTLVFDSGSPNPLSGKRVSVPDDTYTWLSLTAGLADPSLDGAPWRAHLWSGGKARPVEIRLEGREALSVLGTEKMARRIVARIAGAKDAAEYWLGDEPPHLLLQYRGPADFLIEAAPVVMLRATASSEQVRDLYGR